MAKYGKIVQMGGKELFPFRWTLEAHWRLRWGQHPGWQPGLRAQGLRGDPESHRRQDSPQYVQLEDRTLRPSEQRLPTSVGELVQWDLREGIPATPLITHIYIYICYKTSIFKNNSVKYCHVVKKDKTRCTVYGSRSLFTHNIVASILPSIKMEVTMLISSSQVWGMLHRDHVFLWKCWENWNSWGCHAPHIYAPFV